MVTSASPRNGSDSSLPDVLPVLRPPIGPQSGKLTPRLPRSAGTTPPPMAITEGGEIPTPAPLPAHISPVAPLTGPGKSIASVLRALPPSGLAGVNNPVCCHAPEESASWPETRWRREKCNQYDEGLGSVLASPRQRFRAPCPPAAEPPSNSGRRPGRRANSEGGREMPPTTREHPNASLSARRSNREDIDKDRQRLPSSSPAVGSHSHPPPRPTKRTPRDSPEHSETVERRKGRDCDLPDTSPRRPRATSSRPGYENSGVSEGTVSGNSEIGDSTPRAASQPVSERRKKENDDRRVGVENIPLSQIEFQGSAKKQARDWFKHFLLEAESEVQAAEAAKIAAAQNPAKVLIDEFDKERQTWEERTRILLQSRGGPIELQVPSELFVDDGSLLHQASKNSFRASTKCIEIMAEEDSSDECQDGQIAAAFREAGLESGIIGVRDLATTDEISPSKRSSRGFDVDSARTNGEKAQWAMPSREWAAQRLRRKREKARQSMSSTPSGTSGTTTCTPTTPLLHSNSQVSV